jgi:hypothetical protein
MLKLIASVLSSVTLVIVSAVFMLVLTGCSTTRKANRDFPAWATQQCYGGLNESEAIIKRVGAHRVSPRSVTVEFVPGTKRSGNQWAWYISEPSWPNGGMYVLGVCYGNRVQVGIDPKRANDPTAINMSTLIHELTHHWLMSNGIGGNHFPQYDNYVEGWGYSRSVVGFGGVVRDSITIDGVHYDVIRVAE